MQTLKLVFGVHLDEQAEPRSARVETGVLYAGPRSLLSYLEAHLGLSGYPENIEYLRIEQYRQALAGHLLAVAKQDTPEEVFYEKSFGADQFATAAELLSRRDEIVLAGWDFLVNENTPPRLRNLAEVEALYTAQTENDAEGQLILGFADHFMLMLRQLEIGGHPFTGIKINEPLEMLPGHFQHLFGRLSAISAKPLVEQITFPPDWLNPRTDLQKIQNSIATGQQPKDTELKADGSLLLIRAKRGNEAAAFTAKAIRLNPSFRPVCLIPEKNRTLDIALIREGLPSLGTLSASLARPALQILKLAPTFLWHPIDPFKILEFVSLAIKPLPDKLATTIADQVARSPGLQGEGWYAMVNRYFSELELAEPAKTVAGQRKQYGFWFERKRYDINKAVPKSDAVEIYDFLYGWAYQAFEELGKKNSSLLVLSEQAKRIVELLQALPETEIGYLALERIVRTIYEPSPVTFHEREVGHLKYVMHPSSFVGGVEEVLWWNFVQNEPPMFFSRWYPKERQYLGALGLYLETPDQENARMLWQRTRPVLAAQKRLVLVFPEMVDGSETLPHPLLGNLEAVFGNLEKVTLDVGPDAGQGIFSQLMELPAWQVLPRRQLGRPQPFIEVGKLDSPMREYETFTSLESLFYYPYQWFFKYKIKLHKSAILSVVNDNMLMGNLAHRVFEKLMKEDYYQFDKTTLEGWVEQVLGRLLAQEGAVLLMYGREPERVAFVNKLKYATWSLVCHIRNNNWHVVGTEQELEGQLVIVSPGTNGAERALPVRGIADLVLERDGELAVVDLKWRGASYRTDAIRNKEDLQLVLYSHLVADPGKWAHTSYFIIENGKMIARNNLAFNGIEALAPDVDFKDVNQGILEQMKATLNWRIGQLANGQIEVRTRQTAKEIEHKYSDDGQGELLFELLEMKSEDAKWDDYRTLINLIG